MGGTERKAGRRRDTRSVAPTHQAEPGTALDRTPDETHEFAESPRAPASSEGYPKKPAT